MQVSGETRRIGVLTSGGDSPGMNAAIRAVVRCATEAGLEVYGIERGYEGLLDGDLRPLTNRSVGDILHRGGTMLKTARSPRFETPEGVARGAEMLRTFHIDGLVVIGGDGSLHGGLDLSRQGITVMGLPGTIDNDLAYTDFTIGFDTAVNTVLDAISKLRDTSSSHNRTTVVEVMGRHCGDIALHAGLAGGAEAILVPEVPVDVDAVCRRILEGSHAGKLHSIIIKAEGADISSEALISTIQERTEKDTKLVVLSYLQRGGSPTMFDRDLATLTAAKAISCLVRGMPSQAIGIRGGVIVACDLAEALQMKRPFNMEMYELIGVLSR